MGGKSQMGLVYIPPAVLWRSFPVWYCMNCGKVIIADKDMLPVNPLEEKPGEPFHAGVMNFYPRFGIRYMGYIISHSSDQCGMGRRK